MPLPFVQSFVTARSKPQVIPDGTVSQNGARGGRYGEQYANLAVPPGKQVLADEGSFFVTTNPTVGTAVAGTVQTAFSDTSTGALFTFKNFDSPSNTNAKRIYLDYIKLVVATVPASTTVVNYAVKVQNSLRNATANNTTLTPVNCNMDDGTASIAKVEAFNAGFLTVPAADATARVVARGNIGGLPILGDELVIQFGGIDMAAMGTSGTASRKVSVAAPVIIGPQQSATVHIWLTANAATAGQFEYEIGHWER